MKGTTNSKAKQMVVKSTSGVRHGGYTKNVVTRGNSASKPSGPTSPIKGMDKGGI